MRVSLKATEVAGMKCIHWQWFDVRSIGVEKKGFLHEVVPRSVFYGHLGNPTRAKPGNQLVFLIDSRNRRCATSGEHSANTVLYI